MNNQYHFQLVFLRLSLKRNVLSQSNLKITLIDNNKDSQIGSLALQSEEIKIKKNQKIIDLDALKTFNFGASKENAQSRFTIKYEIRGNGEDRVRTIPIDLLKMIQDYQNTKKFVFEATFGGQNAQLSYKFYLTRNQSEVNFNLLVTPQNKEEQENGEKTKRSNSISRSKRPPNLNINRRNVSPPPSQTQSQSVTKPVLKHLPSNNHGSLLTMSPISPDVNKMPLLNLNNLESHEENNSSVSGTQKKVSSLPLSQIEKVNQLMATHHRPHEGGHHQAHHLSYKLKIVIIMLIIGIAFLLFDTLSDRKIRKRQKQKSHDDHHSQHDEHGHEQHHQQQNHAHKQQKTHKNKKLQAKKINHNKKKIEAKNPKNKKKQ